MVIGKTYEELSVWHPRYAFTPIRLNSGLLVWLEWVEQRRIPGYVNGMDACKWEYRAA